MVQFVQVAMTNGKDHKMRQLVAIVSSIVQNVICL